MKLSTIALKDGSAVDSSSVSDLEPMVLNRKFLPKGTKFKDINGFDISRWNTLFGRITGNEFAMSKPHQKTLEYKELACVLKHITFQLQYYWNIREVPVITELMRGKHLICFCAPHQCHGDS